MVTKLSVNVNGVAFLRNRRSVPWPSLIEICRIALDAGAYGITVHPRPDERHIRRSDAAEIRDLLRKDYPSKEYNIEGYPSEDFLKLVEAAKPDQVTLVPDDPSQSTSDHGWNFARERNLLTEVVKRLKGSGMRVSLFADADAEAVPLAAETGTDRIELYTGPYGGSFDAKRKEAELARLRKAGEAARRAGLEINAGHDLTRANLPPLLGVVPFIAEVSIGHAIVADSLIYGMAETVRMFREACGDPV